MREITTKVYFFSELSEEAQEKALDECRYFNVDDSYWHECIAPEGVKIVSFCLDKNIIKIEFTENPYEVAKHVAKNWNNSMRQNAEWFLHQCSRIEAEMEAGDGLDRDELDEIVGEFKHSLGEEILSVLRMEYEYQISDAVVRETIEANGYEFTEDGKLI